MTIWYTRIMGAENHMTPHPGNPEWLAGLQEGQTPEELVFALPGMGDDELRYVVEAGNAIAGIAEEAWIRLGKIAVRFLPFGDIATSAYELSELMDGTKL